MKILCAGDLHIGRRPSRLPDHVDCGPLSCASTWTAVVEKAIAEGVDLVALSGDVVDETNKYYEAVGPLEAGIRRLAARGIRTVAVSGNHDHDVLPWLTETLPREAFTLLGRHGRWDRFTLERDGRPVLHIDGWSFPDRMHRADPLRGYEPQRTDGVPLLGLLHCDLDQPRSTHAPVSLVDLRARPAGFWLLGHVHGRRLDEAPGGAAVLYPGSPQAMDPGETGAHGVWMVEIDAGGRFAARPLALATVRYDVAEVDLSGVDDEGEVHNRITRAVREKLEECVAEGCGPLRYLSLRLWLTGRTRLHRRLESICAGVPGDMEMERDGVVAMVERVTVDTRPAREMEELARAQDAPGELARLIRALRSGELSPGQEALLRAATRAAADVRSAKPYRVLCDEPDLPPETTVRILAECSELLLDELLAQKEDRG